MSMKLGNAHFRLTPDPARGLVRLERTAEPMPADPDDIGRVFADVETQLRPFFGQKILLDIRYGPPGRTDDAFEAVTRVAANMLTHNFARIAVLVRSAAGKLQVRRLSGGQHNVFQDEDEALRYLEGF